MSKTRIIPFDINKAKNGAKVVTRAGYPVKMIAFDLKHKDGYKLVGIVEVNDNEIPFNFKETGCRVGTEVKSDFDLFIEEEIPERLMTNQELADWLCDCPEERREYKYTGGDLVRHYHDYLDGEGNTTIENVLVRRNHGEWMKPLINIE